MKVGVLINVVLGNIPLKFVIDSGASANLMSEKTWKELLKGGMVYEMIPKENINKRFIAYGSHTPLKIILAFRTMISTGKSCEKADFFVVENGSKPLLGKDTSLKLNVLKIGLPVNQINTVEFPYIKGVQVKLTIDESVTPITQPVRRVPIAFEGKIEKKIQELLDSKIIEKVNEPCDWVSPIVPVGKNGGDLRLCVDMRRANMAIKRESYPLPTFETIIARLRKSEIFSKLDLKNAYHQVMITPETRYITTFITLEGLFRFRRLMFGISCAPEKFQKIMDHILVECDGSMAYLDDVIVWGKDLEEHDHRLNKVLETFKRYNVLLNESKCSFRQSNIIFMGHKISKEGIFPLESKIDAIQRFRDPTSAEEVRSFLGTVTYLARFIPNLATLSDPLRKLLRLEEAFVWGKDQVEAFQKLKNILSTSSNLGFFDVNDETKLYCDASPVGLGAILAQQDRQSKENRVIAYASRSLSTTEKNYYQTEKEALSLVWAVEKFKYYLYGIEFKLITDCKALEFLFSPKSKPCARLERWILRLMSFNYKIVHKPGKQNIADSCSRLAIANGNKIFDEDTEEYVYHVVDTTRPASLSIDVIKETSKSDPQLISLREALSTGIWREDIAMYKPFELEICEFDNIMLRGTRLIPPVELREKMLEVAHEGHLGMSMMKRRLRVASWWPNMDKDVENFVKKCRNCLLVSVPNPPIPVLRRPLPSEPWEDLAVDFLGPLAGENVFVVVDYYSRYMEIEFMKEITTKKTVFALKAMIGRHGYPRTLTADNGPQFRSEEFKEFCIKEGIELNLTTPYWPQANGEVERQNRSLMKNIKISAQEGKDWKEELLTYQASYHLTPHSVTGKSPGSLMQKVFRDKLPSIVKDIEWENDNVIDRDIIMKEKGQDYINNKRKTKESEISIGDTVVPLKLRKTGKMDSNYESVDHTVVERSGGETVIQNNETGVKYKRHVNHLKKVPENTSTTNPDAHSKNDCNEPEIEARSHSKRNIRIPGHLKDYV